MSYHTNHNMHGASSSSEESQDEPQKSTAQPRRGKSNATKHRDQQRQYRNHTCKNSDNMKKIQKELGCKLCFGSTTPAHCQSIVPARQARVMAVSTRSIGFCIQSIFVQFNQQISREPPCTATCYNVYRVSLAQVEMRLLSTHAEHAFNLKDNTELFLKPRLTPEQRDFLSYNQRNLPPIAYFIKAIGNLENPLIYFKIPKFEERGQLIPMSSCVTFSTLRQTVTALANLVTPQPIRLNFYNNNPLPGARWGPREDDPEWPLLLNPDDFMPEDYGVDDLEDDANKLNGLITWLARKSNGFFNGLTCTCIDYKASGEMSALVSNHCVGLRNPQFEYDLRPGQENEIDWAKSRGTSGDLREFWSPFILSSPESYMGALILAGELPADARGPVTALRTEECAEQSFQHPWTHWFHNFVN